MSTAISSKRSTRFRAPRLAALALGAALAIGSAPAGAVWPVQETGLSLVQHLMNQINTYHQKIQDAAEYVEQKTRWLRTLEQYRQALIRVQAAMNSFGLPDGAPLVPVPANYLVAETCGGSPDLSPMGLFKTFVFNPGGDMKEQQTQICVNIRMMQNRKYNDSVQFLSETVPMMQSSLGRIFGIRLGSNDEGNVRGADSESLRTANDLAVMAQTWEARMKSYDAYIEVMEQNQKVVAHSALKGKPSVISDLVKTAALKGALSID